LASTNRKTNIAEIRTLFRVMQSLQNDGSVTEVIPLTLSGSCPSCDNPMCITEVFRRGQNSISRARLRDSARFLVLETCNDFIHFSVV
jgi:hypothetical protein